MKLWQEREDQQKTKVINYREPAVRIVMPFFFILIRAKMPIKTIVYSDMAY